ncbi:MAG: type II secretion system F family protein [Segniliparus sp.]|uniref:type II secretion system F family protein n=1 Tax=Segniliparus sp. TaxID=2804064 RepID=UPI003F2BFD52
MTWALSWAGAAASLALALLVAPSPQLWLSRIRSRAAAPLRSGAEAARLDPLALAASYDLFAVSLQAGLPTPVALRAVARSAPPPLSAVLVKAAHALQLGADPQAAWEDAAELPATAPLARMAKRSARSGAALADGLVELAAAVRADALDQATAGAGRAGVLLAGPLGLCFLPAFLCLGVIPVIIGLGSEVFGDGGRVL